MSQRDGELSVREADRRGVGGPVAKEVRDDPPGWMANANQAVLLVHGFNNNQKEARKAYEKFRANLPTGIWRVGEVQWPGDADFGFLQWLDFLSYPTEIPDARDSAERLAAFLAKLARTNPTIEITLVGHSLGCRLILELLDRFETGKSKPAPTFRRILLMAAAVPVKLSEPGKRLYKAGAQARERLVLFSPDDLVLRFAFPAGQTLAKVPFGYEQDIYLEPVGLHGHPEAFATETPLQACGNGHGDYWGDEDAAAYLAQKLGVAVPHRLKERCLPKHERPAANELPAHWPADIDTNTF